MCALCEIDVDYFFFDDTPPDKDPDSHSPTLRRYHQLLWSKPLPDGRPFELHPGRALSPYLVYEADGTRIVLGSDTIATRHRRKLFRLYEQLPKEVNDAFLRRSYTICGFMVFPVSRGSINQNRGTHPRIQDRWDLTLEAIRRFYDGGPSPLASTLDRHAGFFELFGSFAGYVDHFVLGDFIDERGAVRFLLPFDDFKTPALPSDLPTYERYRKNSLALFEARRLSILKEIERRCTD
ncbi:hypothetical protein J2W20_002344 [Sinomonas atrocyanea]|uniref:DUF6994 family protein n=1 Tax=Sinomonas atrocyanea TaxID=37927 RepID=UPI00277D4956|nr:hypothetical protein [Sinomonas atrocyanea]MDQ0260440.1 hypothetical protein [Sinomonas atrocyanea]